MTPKCILYSLLAIGLLEVGTSPLVHAQEAKISQQDHTLRLGTLKDSAPWTNYKNEQWSGFGIEMYNDMFGSFGKTLDILPYDNWPRLTSELTVGNLDVSLNFRLGTDPLPVNNSMVCTHAPFVTGSWGGYVLSDSKVGTLEKQSDLARYRIATTRIINRDYLPEFKANRLTQVKQPSQLLMLLRSKRADLVLVPSAVTDVWRAQFSIETKEVLNLGYYFAHLCFSTTSLGVSRAEMLRARSDDYLKREAKRIKYAYQLYLKRLNTVN